LVSLYVGEAGVERKKRHCNFNSLFGWFFSLGYPEKFSQKLFYQLIRLQEPQRTLYPVRKLNASEKSRTVSRFIQKEIDRAAQRPFTPTKFSGFLKYKDRI